MSSRFLSLSNDRLKKEDNIFCLTDKSLGAHHIGIINHSNQFHLVCSFHILPELNLSPLLPPNLQSCSCYARQDGKSGSNHFQKYEGISL
jgi:hypothetical protein